MRAFNLIRHDPVYRHDAFTAGLKAVGYDVVIGQPVKIQPGDVLLTWNRYGANHDLACRFEKVAGCHVLIAENGYIGLGGISPHNMPWRNTYALARGAHNDDQVIPWATPERWRALGVDLKPWRTDGGHVLVCPNRPFGVPGRMMPPNWSNEVVDRLKKLTKRPIRLRPHPGNDPPKRPLADDLADAWACVIWSSSAGVHALCHGIPTISCAPAWIAHGAAGHDLADIEAPPMPDRLPAMERLACGQFGLSEISDGTAFRAVLAPEPEMALA